MQKLPSVLGQRRQSCAQSTTAILPAEVLNTSFAFTCTVVMVAQCISNRILGPNVRKMPRIFKRELPRLKAELPANSQLFPYSVHCSKCTGSTVLGSSAAVRDGAWCTAQLKC